MANRTLAQTSIEESIVEESATRARNGGSQTLAEHALDQEAREILARQSSRPTPAENTPPHWKTLTAMWTPEQAEHAIVDGFELTALVLGADPARGWPRQIAWELHGGPTRTDLVATGPATSLADAKAQAEAAWHTARARVPLDPSRAIELAYGLLWEISMDTRSPTGLRVSLARRALLEQLDRAGQARGIALARDALLLPELRRGL